MSDGRFSFNRQVCNSIQNLVFEFAVAIVFCQNITIMFKFVYSETLLVRNTQRICRSHSDAQIYTHVNSYNCERSSYAHIYTTHMYIISHARASWCQSEPLQVLEP